MANEQRRVLVGRAEQGARFHGHQLVWTVPSIYGPDEFGVRYVQDAACSTCGECVQVDTRPPADGIDVGGPAIATSCPRAFHKQTWPKFGESW